MIVSHTAILPSPDDVQVDGETFTLNTDNSSVILFDPVINKGIVRFEVLVIKVGIAVESARFGRNDQPTETGFENVARFMHNTYQQVCHMSQPPLARPARTNVKIILKAPMGIGPKLAEPNLSLAQIVGPIPINALMETYFIPVLVCQLFSIQVLTWEKQY
ncbi:MAG: hypothetical protein EZS28_023657 [Streblomastix strix]|uniref:Uncharacterized protein n=1 Tax=Streblomastix strix TaxID=222440 RepID=A0A5J4VE79_9EUKA|nr:MAG: hypothetical protein EZS28_023657 [Streblomastix strix]